MAKLAFSQLSSAPRDSASRMLGLLAFDSVDFVFGVQF